MPEDSAGVSGSQLLSDDSTPPLRALLVLYGDSNMQLWHKDNQNVFPAGLDPDGVPYLFISHICLYATSPRLMMKFYKDLLCVECRISPADEQTIRRWDDPAQSLLNPVSKKYEERCHSNTESPGETSRCEPSEDDKSTWSIVQFPPVNVASLDVDDLRENFRKYLGETHPSLLEHGDGYRMTYLYKQKDDSFFSQKRLLELRLANYVWKHYAGSFLTGDWFGREKEISPFNHYSLHSVEEAFMAATQQTEKRPLHLLTAEKVARSATVAVIKYQHSIDNVEYNEHTTVAQRVMQMQPKDIAALKGSPSTADSPAAASSATVSPAETSAQQLPVLR